MTVNRKSAASPDQRSSLAQYRRRAPYYDVELAPFEPLRRMAITRLALRHGDTVLDVGCGTGLSLGLLHDAVGADGAVIGIEPCAEMIELARHRVHEQGWRNVTLLEAAADVVEIADRADAALFHFTHDVLQQPAALDNLTRRLRAGAPVVACGLQWAPPWAWPVNLFVLGAALHSVTSFDGLREPWQGLAGYLDTVRVDTHLAGGAYIASGVLRQRQ